jgi:hypothetical protein
VYLLVFTHVLTKCTVQEAKKIMYVLSNIEARSCNHLCSINAMSIKYLVRERERGGGGGVFVLRQLSKIQSAFACFIAISGVSGCAIYLQIIS